LRPQFSPTCYTRNNGSEIANERSAGVTGGIEKLIPLAHEHYEFTAPDPRQQQRSISHGHQPIRPNREHKRRQSLDRARLLLLRAVPRAA
jgi:hypothetical protein